MTDDPKPRRQKLQKVYPDPGYDPYYRHVAQDRTLTFKARGLHVYMLSKPSGWKFSASEIARDQGVGRDLVETGLKELKDHGLYEVVQERDDRGRFETFGRVYAVPLTDPMLANPVTGDSAGKSCATTDAGETGERTTRSPENPAPKETSSRELPPDDSLRSSSARATTRRGQRLPADWEPDEALKRWTRAEVADTSVLPGRELIRFRNYWAAKSGRDAAKLDWSATWQNWIMKAVEQAGGLPPSQAGPSEATRHPGYRPAREVLAEQESALGDLLRSAA